MGAKQSTVHPDQGSGQGVGVKPLVIRDEPVCCRELKPGVARENHRLSDHVDYEERDVRGGHDCLEHQYVDPGHCGICHERKAMIEVAMVFDREGRALFWPAPQGSAGSIPDSALLWDRIWACRDVIGGIVHTHPWEGAPSPSHTDVTTFAAIEAGLGKRLIWPIVTMDQVGYYQRIDSGQYVTVVFPSKELRDFWMESTGWGDIIEELRRLSRNEGV